ncbi:MAG: DUF3131 domain-containing protein [Thermoanaerobaculia bacterium]|nr:DUF3131 domain-containing protein [Thermoanaerobaculia bacterium]
MNRGYPGQPGRLLLGVAAATILALGAQGEDLGPYRTGFVLSQQGRMLEAAESWTLTAERLQATAQSTDEGQIAGIGFVLSTIAYERADDARAYSLWARAVEAFLNSHTRWPEHRETLVDHRAEIESRLRGLSADSDLGAIDGATLFFLQLDDALGLTSYSGPKPGLAEPRATPEAAAAGTENREYFARPLSVIERESQGGGAVDPAENPDLAKSVSARRLAPADAAGNGGGSSTEERVRPPQRAIVPAPNPASAPPDEVPAAPAPSAGADSTPGNLESPEGLEPLKELEPVEGLEPEPLESGHPGSGHPGPNALSPEDRALASDAWAYLERNRQPTGLVNSVEGYPYVTMWEVASTLAALHAAPRLSLVEVDEAIGWLESLLHTLATLPLYRDEVPNREYDTRDASIASPGRPGLAGGSGWSSLDLGRLLIWLRITELAEPSLAEQVRAIVDSWDLERLYRGGELNSTWFDGGQEEIHQEGRLGYEQYAAAGLALWGLPVPRARDYEETETGFVDGVEILQDRRDLPFLTSDPFVLGMIELGGVDQRFRELTSSLFEAQRRRWQREDKITAAGEDALNRAPWFVYNNLLYQGRAWLAVSQEGAVLEDLFGWSAKNALGWWALGLDPEYGSVLRQEVESLRDPGQGIWAGKLDSGGINRSLNVNTHAVILEILLYVHRGGEPLLKTEPPSTDD